MNYKLNVYERNFLSNEDFSVFNTNLTWIFKDFKKISKENCFNFFNIDFLSFNGFQLYEIEKNSFQHKNFLFLFIDIQKRYFWHLKEHLMQINNDGDKGYVTFLDFCFLKLISSIWNYRKLAFKQKKRFFVFRQLAMILIYS